MADFTTYDQPFIYVFNADNTPETGGAADPVSLSKALQGDFPFFLRRVTGMRNLTPDFKMYRAGGQAYMMSDYIRFTADGNSFVVCPEEPYPLAGFIRFDCLGIRKNGPGADSTANFRQFQLCFQGVKRKPIPAGWNGFPILTPYKYKLVPFTYINSVTLTAKLATSPAVISSVAIDDYDFELYRITQTVSGLNVPGTCSLVLKDYAGNATSDDRVPDSALCDFAYAEAHYASPSIFPVPALVYPKGSQLNMDVFSSTYNSTLTETIQFAFHGARRIPCA